MVYCLNKMIPNTTSKAGESSLISSGLIATPDRNYFCRKTYTSNEISHRKNNFGELNWWNKYMLFAGWRSVWWKTVTEVLKMLPEAAGPRQHFQAWGHSFSLYGPTLGRQITCLFFSWSKLVLKIITNGFAYATLSLNRLARRLLIKKSSQRASNSDTRQRCIKEEYFSIFFTIVAFISPFISLNLTMLVFCIGKLLNSWQRKSFFDVVKEERSRTIKV